MDYGSEGRCTRWREPFTGELAGTADGVGLANKSMGRGLRAIAMAMARMRQLGKVEASCIGRLGMSSLSLWALPLTTRLITNPPATSERIGCIRLECVECLDFCLNLQPTFCYVLTTYSSTPSLLILNPQRRFQAILVRGKWLSYNICNIQGD